MDSNFSLFWRNPNELICRTEKKRITLGGPHVLLKKKIAFVKVEEIHICVQEWKQKS